MSFSEKQRNFMLTNIYDFTLNKEKKTFYHLSTGICGDS